eukprot:scaffold14896_cov111-Isochrysis_galbana.AAC.2
MEQGGAADLLAHLGGAEGRDGGQQPEYRQPELRMTSQGLQPVQHLGRGRQHSRPELVCRVRARGARQQIECCSGGGQTRWGRVPDARLKHAPHRRQQERRRVQCCRAVGQLPCHRHQRALKAVHPLRVDGIIGRGRGGVESLAFRALGEVERR